ncbi:diaminopimelate epimerase [Reinekea marina]|uniref:Diaminopimelate epimerase n=1 Tax=Reinekea marina TaxID=1310421 RepID=A0ABV7WX90_9GAMM|nr:diaminopimelate epimerase [Reinekea marina]MBU2864232.1 diaminopimelate epimerase [Reinekea forsetii]MDN3647380.1 diaminopimelate epimerase [Reinekea marina]
MRLKFTKMHGLGNDFMVVDGVSQEVELSPELIEQWADRHFGVGFDQLLLVEPPTRPDRDFKYRIFNADGTEVENCGNGARCFARFVLDAKLIKATTIRVETAGGDLELHVQEDGQVTVDMGRPRLNPSKIPFNADEKAPLYPIEVNGETLHISAVGMGNPHCVIRTEDVDTAEVEALGTAVESHSDFPQRVNVGFMQIVSPTHIKLRVFERGVGETMACGTGACAAVVAGIINNWLEHKVTVTLPGGDLTIEWSGEGNVRMTGPVATVYQGVLV